jgi:TRAP-type C4-dicarboxylate transport system permease small subunit
MKILDYFEEWVMSLMLLGMTALSFMQVVRRYVFNTGFSWTLELTMVLFAFMIFLGISYGVRVGAHIGVDALVSLRVDRGGSTELGIRRIYFGGLMDLREQDDDGWHRVR